MRSNDFNVKYHNSRTNEIIIQHVRTQVLSLNTQYVLNLLKVSRSSVFVLKHTHTSYTSTYTDTHAHTYSHTQS